MVSAIGFTVKLFSTVLTIVYLLDSHKNCDSALVTMCRSSDHSHADAVSWPVDHDAIESSTNQIKCLNPCHGIN